MDLYKEDIMANIIVCYKWVLDEEDLKINPGDLSVDASKAKGKISEYDRNAIAAAVNIAGATGNQAVALSYGNPSVKNSLKDALSRGPSAGYWVNDQGADTADGFVTSSVLAAAISSIGSYNLIICGEGAADTYARQIGPRLGAILNLPVISCVYEMYIEGNRLIATRKLEDCLETVSVVLPAVVTVLPEICPAPIPGLKAVLDAGKKPTSEFNIASLGLDPASLAPKRTILDFKGYAADRKKQMIKGDSPAASVLQLVNKLKQEGVL